MAKATDGKKTTGGLLRRLNSLRVQVGSIVLISYLVPALLLGIFTGAILLPRLEEKTRSAVSSSAEHAFTMTEQNVSRSVELARGATYDGELTAAWEKWQAGDAADTAFIQQCKGYLERKYSREPLVSYAACFPVRNPEMIMSLRNGSPGSAEELHELRTTAMAIGERLDTRCRFFRLGGRMYLVRNLLNLRMERFGILILGIDSGRLLLPLKELERTWNAEAAVRLDASRGGFRRDYAS